MKSDQELKEDGFTRVGIERYRATVKGYADEVHERSVAYGEADKPRDLNREVTHEHVRAAALSIASTYGRDRKSPLWVVCQVIEYLFTAASAYALGNSTEPWSTPVFIISAVLAGILIAFRVSNSKSN